MPKIFISHNSNDKQIVEPIAIRLSKIYGQNNVFYDSWSIQPGDSIIGKMNQGLEEFTTFFYFISQNSLDSKMVLLEWQTALNRAVNNEIKFVAVRISDCKIPAILQNSLYIDLYGEGIDDAVEKMRKTILSETVYKPLDNIQNLRARAERINDNTIRVVVEALHYAENDPIMALACKNRLDEISVCYNVSDGMTIQRSDRISVENGLVLNSKNVYIQRAIKPGFPFVFEVYYDNIDYYERVALYKLVDANKSLYERVPLELSFEEGISAL